MNQDIPFSFQIGFRSEAKPNSQWETFKVYFFMCFCFPVLFNGLSGGEEEEKGEDEEEGKKDN